MRAIAHTKSKSKLQRHTKRHLEKHELAEVSTSEEQKGKKAKNTIKY